MHEPRTRFAHAAVFPAVPDPNAKPDDHGGRTKHLDTVRVPDGTEGVLKSGQWNRKYGDKFSKGVWRGMPLFGLTLEERATCNPKCPFFAGFNGILCYMDKAGHRTVRRWMVGAELYHWLDINLQRFQNDFDWGFTVRLHTGGDFANVEYVEFWLTALDRYPALRLWGYTHWTPDDPIGALIKRERDARWSKFAIRFSDSTDPERAANTIFGKPDKPVVPQGIVCPEQTGRTKNCGTCGLCPSTNKNIAFIAH